MLLSRYLRILRLLRRYDLPRFQAEHSRLYREARESGDFSAVTRAYYAVMAEVIEEAYGSSWHFCAPERRGQSREEATRRLHDRIARLIQLGPGQTSLDIGCGIGGALRDIARSTGGHVLGITLGENEVRKANQAIAESGLDPLCRVVCGDYQAMPLADASVDSAYAIYSLKYFPDLHRVFREVHRVLRPGGLFCTYDIVKTARYASHPEHAGLVDAFEFACGMPSLHTARGMIEAGQAAGLECLTEMDLSDGLPWYHFFSDERSLSWATTSPTVRRVLEQLDRLGLLPAGFASFNATFLAGTVQSLVAAGKLGVLSGSSVLVFRKATRSGLCREAASRSNTCPASTGWRRPRGSAFIRTVPGRRCHRSQRRRPTCRAGTTTNEARRRHAPRGSGGPSRASAKSAVDRRPRPPRRQLDDQAGARGSPIDVAAGGCSAG